MPAITTLSAKVSIKNTDRLLRKLEALALQVLPQATATALNRVANTVKSRASKDISVRTGLKVSSVRRRVVITKRASKSDPRAVIEITGRPLNLVEFASGKRTPRSPRGGITARAWGRRRKYPGVFLARMPNGQVIAVKRSAPGKTRSKLIRKGRWAGKSPHIESVWGPGIVKEAVHPVLVAARDRAFRERFPIELKSQLAFRISKLLVKRK